MSLNNFHDKIISHAESKPDQEVCGVVLLCPDLSVEIKQDGISTTSIYPAIVYTRMSAPTPWMHLLPGMTTDDAAHVIERAIIEKPYDILHG